MLALLGMSSSNVKVTVVANAEELQGAVKNSARHIQIREHIDLTQRMPLSDQQDIVKKMLGWPGEGVETIRGACQKEPSSAFENSIGGTPLRERKSSQCILITDMDLLRVQSGPMWLDNIYVRLKRSGRDEQPLLIETVQQGRAYLTNVTLQGDGDQFLSCQAVKASAGALIQDSELSHLGGEGMSALLAEGSTGVAWIQNTIFDDIDATAPGAAIKVDYEGSAVALQSVEFQDVSGRTQLIRTDRNGRVFSDVAEDVLSDVTDTVEASEPIASSSEIDFVRDTDPWLTERQEMLSNLGDNNYERYTAPSEKSSGGTVILISVLGVMLLLFVGLALLWRGRRKRNQARLDDWGLPVRTLKPKTDGGDSQMQTMSCSGGPSMCTPAHTSNLIQSTNTVPNSSSIVGEDENVHFPQLRTSGGAASNNSQQQCSNPNSNNSRTQASSQQRSPEIGNAPMRGTVQTSPYVPSGNPNVPDGGPMYWNAAGTIDSSHETGAQPDVSTSNMPSSMPVSSFGTMVGSDLGPPPQAYCQLSPEQQAAMMRLQQQQQMPPSGPMRAASAHAAMQGSGAQVPPEQRRGYQSAQLRSCGSNSSALVPAHILDDLGSNPASAAAAPMASNLQSMNTDLSYQLQMASMSSSKHGTQASRGDGTIMNALNAYRAHIAAAVHDSLENDSEVGADGVRPRHRTGAGANEYAYSAAAVAASRRAAANVAPPASGLNPPASNNTMSTKDTFEMSGPLAHMKPPHPTASVDEKLDFIDVQLNSFGKETVLTLYECLGASERRRGGQALIQFARRIHSREEFALKFFLSRTDFEAEAACYRSAHLGTFMPAVERYVDNDDGLFRDSAGNAMPPCIVIERGESLRDRMKIAHADRAGIAQILVNVALRLSDLHQAGWVHRDLKPGNVLWLPRKQRWTLIDFALATHQGVETPVIFTPSYAAPEIVKAATENRALIRAHSSMDSWALGVMAFELLSGEAVFDPSKMTIDDVYAQLLGKEQLPWEGDRMTSDNWKKLGIFRPHVLKLLARDPAERMTMQQFAAACDSIFDSRSVTSRTRAFVTTK